MRKRADRQGVGLNRGCALRGARLAWTLPLVFFQGCDGTAPQRASTDASSANARPSSRDAGDGDGELLFLTMRIGGGQCSEHHDCWESLGVERPDQLVLKDKQGKLSFDLAAYEFDHVGAMARDPRFKEKVDDSLAGRDCGGFDIGISMQFQLDGAAVVDVPHVDNCALAPERGQPPTILYEVISYLTSLKKKHLDCPPWQIPGGWQPGVDALPQRALCWNCSGECGGDRDAAVTRPQPPTIPTGGTAGDADAGAE